MLQRNILLLLALLILSGAYSQEIPRIKITDLEEMMAKEKKPLLVNFWATWCKPCVEEIPYFIEEVNAYNARLRDGEDSIRLWLLSLDFKELFPQGIQDFIKKRNFTAPVLWLDETNADYFCPRVDAKWSGAIPATLFLNPATGYRRFVEEQLSHEELKREIGKLTGREKKYE